MRLLFSFLATFMLLSGQVFAQNSCQITNLEAKVVTTQNCEYFVEINFKHQGTTNQFKVTGGGVVFGVFTYNQLPVKIGPFVAPSTPSTRSFAVRDAVLADCVQETSVAIPACGTAACAISDVTADPTGCNAAKTAYSLKLNFKVNAPTNTLFDVWSANGKLVGTYKLDQLPVTIPEFPWNGQTVDVVKICINDNPNCCAVREFKAPDCLIAPCGITGLKVEADSCTSNETFRLKINFTVNDPTAVDSFELRGNGKLIGKFAYKNLPLTLDKFVWNGLLFQNIRIQTGNSPNCVREIQFPAPGCMPFKACQITNIYTTVGVCATPQTYNVLVNFQATNPGSGKFEVKANGNSIGIYPFSALPLLIPKFPWNGTTSDKITICVLPADPTSTAGCCESKTITPPACLSKDCIVGLDVQVGDCTSNTTYKVGINFKIPVVNAVGQFGVWSNGKLVGTFSTSQLPLTIEKFPWGGGAVDVLKICLITDPAGSLGCCTESQIKAPACLTPGCGIANLAVQTGKCTSTETYELWVNFTAAATASQEFTVYANGVNLGNFKTSQLPLYLPKFPWSGKTIDVIKVCLVPNSNTTAPCCAALEFKAPDCLIPSGCQVYDMAVKTGVCKVPGSYEVYLDFKYKNAPSDKFVVFANGKEFGTYAVNQLPLYIAQFPTDGGPNDVIRVCFLSPISSTPPCCETIEFPVPACAGQTCEIKGLAAEIGKCTSEKTYEVWVKFAASNTTPQVFTISANGIPMGTYKTTQLPVYIQYFPWSGKATDVIKVCMVGINSATTTLCCESIEIKAPDCLTLNPCDIYDLTYKTGECKAPGTYELGLDFKVANPPSDKFILWADGKQIGTYGLNELPLYFAQFPTNGGPNDVLQVCFANSNTLSSCCEKLEIPVPACVGNTCAIKDLAVQTGKCTSSETYELWLKFAVQNAPSDLFVVFANGVNLGTFKVSQLPIYIEKFPWGGKAVDVVKVCFVGNAAGTVTCCAALEFKVPTCLGQVDCKIYDLQVLATPCICGQFFAVLQFQHQGGGTKGFDIVGNGVNYGNFGYDKQQPIIIGPLQGDGITAYEFVVRDHENQNCQDVAELGKVKCELQQLTGDNNPAAATAITLSPNPATSRIHVQSLRPGTALVEVYQPDGRRVLQTNVADASSFELNIDQLANGLYRLVITTDSGRAERTFAKQ